LQKLPAFAAFQNGIRERCAEPPVPKGAAIRRQLSHAGRELITFAWRRRAWCPSRPQPSTIERLLVAMRPTLHRYCARMVGSVIDGEDVLQDALTKAVEAHASGRKHRQSRRLAVPHRAQTPRWISCAGATARRRCGEPAEVDMIVDQLDAVESRPDRRHLLAHLHAPAVAQRSSVILMDVLGCSLTEICEVMDCSLPAAKAALHRGRAQLREIADEPEDTPAAKLIGCRSRAPRRLCPPISTRAISTRSAPMIRRRRAGSTSSSKSRMRARPKVSRYFGNYAKASDWRLVPGLVEGHPAYPGVRSERGCGGREILHAAGLGRPARSRPSAISVMRRYAIDGRRIFGLNRPPVRQLLPGQPEL
jgi:RNA polymerase sigma-70 factor (ECF subfamily)